MSTRKGIRKVFNDFVEALSIGSQKVLEDLLAWAIGLKEYVASVHPKVWLFISLITGDVVAFNFVTAGDTLSSLFLDPSFMIACALTGLILGLALFEIMSPARNPDVLDTSD